MEFHDDYPQYEMMAGHSDEQGKPIRRRLWMVFFLLLIITMIELWVGFQWKEWGWSKLALILFFVFFTLVKAGAIVLIFMHLGDENKPLKWVILGPYCAFIVYLAYMVAMNEGTYSNTFKDLLDPVYKMHPVSHHGEGENGKAGHGEKGGNEHHGHE